MSFPPEFREIQSILHYSEIAMFYGRGATTNHTPWSGLCVPPYTAAVLSSQPLQVLYLFLGHWLLVFQFPKTASSCRRAALSMQKPLFGGTAGAGNVWKFSSPKGRLPKEAQVWEYKAEGV